MPKDSIFIFMVDQSGSTVMPLPEGSGRKRSDVFAGHVNCSLREVSQAVGGRFASITYGASVEATKLVGNEGTLQIEVMSAHGGGTPMSTAFRLAFQTCAATDSSNIHILNSADGCPTDCGLPHWLAGLESLNGPNRRVKVSSLLITDPPTMDDSQFEIAAELSSFELAFLECHVSDFFARTRRQMITDSLA